MTPVLTVADRWRTPCLLDTCDPANVPAYERLGFWILHAEPVLDGLTLRVMGRGV
jgi:hypothetical protein